jgi:type IV secretory pathway VirB10-like protein
VGEPDDPLRADDALVGTESEDVLLDSGAADEGESRAEYAGYVDPAPDDPDEHPTSVASLDDRPTTELPPVVGPAPEPRGRLAGLAPWAVFAAVAVVVIAATTTWAAWLQGPTADRQSATPMIIQPVPTATVAAPPTVAAAPPAPAAEPEPDPEPEKAPAARTAQRPRPTRAPAPPPPPAEAVNAPTTPDTKKDTPPATKAPASGAAVAADKDDADSGDKDSQKDTADSEKANSDDEKEAAASEDD